MISSSSSSSSGSSNNGLVHIKGTCYYFSGWKTVTIVKFLKGGYKKVFGFEERCDRRYKRWDCQ